jgi:hypothetical protein
MNLMSCNACGTVLDVDKVGFPEDIWADDDTVNPNLGEWSSEKGKYVPVTTCPVCHCRIAKES